MLKNFRKISNFILVVFVTLLPLNSLSQDTTDLPADDESHFPEVSMRCDITPSLDPSYISFDIKKSNNLLRKAGSPERAKGQYIQLKGKVVDQDCFPIVDAAIKLWQTDSKGKYEEQYSVTNEWEQIDKDYDPNFAFSGVAFTNNLGEFSFITILPASSNIDVAPHFNIEVTHSNFDNVSSRIYFDKHPRNSKDSAFNEISEGKRKLLLAKGSKIDPRNRLEGREYKIKITLRGVQTFRGF